MPCTHTACYKVPLRIRTEKGNPVVPTMVSRTLDGSFVVPLRSHCQTAAVMVQESFCKASHRFCLTSSGQNADLLPQLQARYPQLPATSPPAFIAVTALSFAALAAGQQFPLPPVPQGELDDQNIAHRTILRHARKRK